MFVEVAIIQPSGEITTIRVSSNVIDAAQSLPFAPERYFVVDDDTITLRISVLVQTRARPTGIAAAATLMKLAYEGRHERREPIAVRHWKDGLYLVLDGNSTVTVARAAGWETIPAKLSS